MATKTDLITIVKEFNLEYIKSLKHAIVGVGLSKQDPAKTIILDVRTKKEIDILTINKISGIDVVKLPLEDLPNAVSNGGLSRDKLIITFCPGKIRSTLAWAYLKTEGFEKVLIFDGGYEDIKPYVLPLSL